MTKRGSLQDTTKAYYIGLMNSVGYRKKDLTKPIIGVVNSCNDVNPGHKPLGQLAGYVKEGFGQQEEFRLNSMFQLLVMVSPREKVCIIFYPSEI